MATDGITKHKLQRDFSGGEIGPRMLMRDDTELHARSLLQMENFMPTLQGTAVRSPGSKFIQAITQTAPGLPTNARILPYITPFGGKALVVLTPHNGETGGGEIFGDLTILDNITGDADAPTSALNYRYIVPNGELVGDDNWDLDPPEYICKGNRQGWIVSQGWFNLAMRVGHHNPGCSATNGIMTAQFTMPSVADGGSYPADHIIISPDIFYNGNFGNKDYGISVQFRVGTGTTEGVDVSDIYLGPEIDTLKAGGPHFIQNIVVSGSFTENQVLYISLKVKALTGPGNDGDAVSQPEFVANKLDVLSLHTATISGNEILGVVPYTADELDDVHFVQSPYVATDLLNQEPAKELVMTHSNHPPMRLYYNPTATGYVFEEIFTDDLTQFYGQWDWDTKGYPATCGSYLGRLILAGSSTTAATGPQLVNGASTETVWGTKVGDWSHFSDPDALVDLGVVPTDSISFTAIYRSPIQWVQGQKELLIGAAEVEYTASGEGIFQPADLGVFLQSTHGSNRVQPVPMGQYVLFPAESGKKVRALQFSAQDDGWTSPDQTLAHPGLLSSGIKRMVRMRNPHQMCAVVMGNGQMALYHIDTDAGIQGWSRTAMGGSVRDVAVLSNQDGVDILFMIVRRRVNGVANLYIEAIPSWTVSDEWSYLTSSVTQIAPVATNIITGLEHLEGRDVQVVADANFLGTYTVTAGAITLVNQIAEDIDFVEATVGLAMPCSLKTLPLITDDPTSKKRYTSINVRTLASTRPMINGERASDRDPLSPLGLSQRLDTVYDNTVAVLGSDKYQTIEVTETLPLRLEVVGIFGKIKESSL